MPWSKYLHNRNLIITVAFFAIMLLSVGCGFNTPLTLQQKIRMFFYENQVEAGSMFVEWAEDNLDEHSNRSIMEALYEEGKYHAELGHPNAINVISMAARDWSKKAHLRYNDRDWSELREEAMANLRTEPGQLQIWPTN
jgi:hypothetical protein